MGRFDTSILPKHLRILCTVLFLAAVNINGNNAQRRRPDRDQYVDLCDTPQGLEGECMPLSQCWIIPEHKIDLEMCEGPNEYFCCPDLTEENTEILSPSGGGDYHAFDERPVRRPTPDAFDERPVRRPTPDAFDERPVRRPTPAAFDERPVRRPTPAAFDERPVRKPTPERPPKKTGCGIRLNHRNSEESGVESFVVGGSPARESAWPWMAAILVQSSNREARFLCGGTLITPRHVLTAAHCFDVPHRRYMVMLGTNNITSASSDRRIYRNVRRVIRHNDYVPRKHYDDVAVVVLEANVDLLFPICLPDPQNFKDLPLEAKVFLAGWGHTVYGGKLSNSLQEAGLILISPNRCQQSYQALGDPSLSQGITSKMICAGDPKGGGDACQGDSGGPLMYEENGIWYQVGIVSFGYRCGEKDYPGVYTKIASYLSWINQVLSQYP